MRKITETSEFVLPATITDLAKGVRRERSNACKGRDLQCRAYVNSGRSEPARLLKRVQAGQWAMAADAMI